MRPLVKIGKYFSLFSKLFLGDENILNGQNAQSGVKMCLCGRIHVVSLETVLLLPSFFLPMKNVPRAMGFALEAGVSSDSIHRVDSTCLTVGVTSSLVSMA